MDLTLIACPGETVELRARARSRAFVTLCINIEARGSGVCARVVNIEQDTSVIPTIDASARTWGFWGAAVTRAMVPENGHDVLSIVTQLRHASSGEIVRAHELVRLQNIVEIDTSVCGAGVPALRTHDPEAGALPSDATVAHHALLYDVPNALKRVISLCGLLRVNRRSRLPAGVVDALGNSRVIPTNIMGALCTMPECRVELLDTLLVIWCCARVAINAIDISGTVSVPKHAAAAAAAVVDVWGYKKADTVIWEVSRVARALVCALVSGREFEIPDTWWDGSGEPPAPAPEPALFWDVTNVRYAQLLAAASLTPYETRVMLPVDKCAVFVPSYTTFSSALLLVDGAESRTVVIPHSIDACGGLLKWLRLASPAPRGSRATLETSLGTLHAVRE